ncbi:MAG: phosphoribosylformylglycinamidine synthase I [Firmicutes bacterium ADurb.Bin080]|jgi:phosphoribosylformylglycinamidine (FGAM) synthase-like amidotransferase family enzyme|nr:MAG: phosphoribosylformylglycinamidine synthase I [Firmicutes bacterium ADurb.Bin080]
MDDELNGLPISTVIDFSVFPIHKKITELDVKNDEILNQLLSFLNNRIDIMVLRKIFSIFSNSLSLFELNFLSLILKEIDSTGYLNIEKIEINGLNPHLKHSIEIYNQLNIINKDNTLPRTVKNLRSYATQHLIKSNHTNLFSDGKNTFLKFKTENTDSTGIVKLGISLTSADSVEDSIYKSLLKNFSKGLSSQLSQATTLLSARKDTTRNFSTNPSNIPKLSAIVKLNRTNENHINAVTIGISNFSCPDSKKNINKIILLIIGDKNDNHFFESCNNLAEDGFFSRFSINFSPVNNGFPFPLFSLNEGLDIYLNKLNDCDKSVENLFFSGIKNSFLTCIGVDLSKEIIQFIQARGFTVLEIGKTNKRDRIRIFNSDSLVSDIYLKDIDLLLYKNIVCDITETGNRIEIIPQLSLNDTIDAKIRSFQDFIGCRKDNSFYYANNVSVPYKGIRQIVPSNLHSVYPTILNKNFFIGLSSVCIECLNNTFSGCVNSIILSVFKLVLKGYPIHQVASAISLFIKNNDESSYKEKLLVELGILFTQISFSIPNLCIETFDLVNETIPCIVNAYALGYTNNFLVKESFLPGQKLFLLKIKKDEYNIPDPKYFIKLCSSITIQILSKNITSSIVIEETLISTLMDLCITANCGVSIAPVDNGSLFGNAGNALVSVNDVKELDNIESVYIGVLDNSGLIKITNNNISINEMNNRIYFNNQKNKLYLESYTRLGENPVVSFHKHINKAQLLVIGSDKYSIDIFKFISQKYGLFFNSKYVNYQTQINEEYVKSIRYDISKANIVVICGENISSDKCSEDYLYTLISRPSILDALNELILKNEGLILSTAEGTKTLFKLGLLPYGTTENETQTLYSDKGTVEKGILYRIRISNIYGPWMQDLNIGDVFYFPAPIDDTSLMVDSSKIEFWQKHSFANYIDFYGDFSQDSLSNPNGSNNAIAGVISSKGNIVGFFAPIEKTYYLLEEYNSIMDKLFSSAIKYFKI